MRWCAVNFEEKFNDYVKSLTYGEVVVNSELWHPRFQIPCIPMHNNPGIYTALVVHMLSRYDYRWSYLTSFIYHWLLLEDKWARWPDGSGGNISHDEMLGWGYLSPRAACSYIGHMEHRFGFFPNDKGQFQWNRWMYRFVFLKPFLEKRAYGRASLLGKFLWSVYVIQSALQTRRNNFDADGVIKVWLMCNDPPVSWVAKFWRRRMEKIGLRPIDIFSVYLSECPTLRLIAPERF